MSNVFNFRTTLAAGMCGIAFFLVYTNQERVSDALGDALVIVFWWALFLLTVGSLVVLVLVWRRDGNRANRPVDGSFPLRTFKLPGGGTTIVDINKLVGSAGVFHPGVGWKEFEPGAGWQAQLEYAQRVQITRHLEALTPGDAAQEKTHGAIDMPRAGIPNAATAKWLEGVYSKPQKALPVPPPVPVAPVVAPHTPIPTQQMIASPNAQPTQLAIGESVDGNEIVYIDLRTYPYLRLHGRTQSGKTAMALLLVAQALRNGYEVDIYDTRSGKDWGIFRGYANVIDARQPAVVIDGLRAEMERYRERDAELGKHGVANLHDLAAATGQVYRRRMFVLEELGNQALAMKDEGKEVYALFVRTLRKITTQAGATGIHGLYIDQVPAVWDATVRYNAAMVCFYLPDHGGKVAGYPGACNLPEYHCYFEGRVVRAGHLTDEQIQHTLGHVRSAYVGGATGVNIPANAPTNAPANAPTNAPANAPTEKSQAQWEEFAAAYFRNNPEASQRALTRAMSAVDPAGRPASDFLGGLSSDLFHRFSPQGNHYQPPADEYGWVAGKEE